MCVKMCPPCKHSQIACSVSTCVPDIVVHGWLWMTGGFFFSPLNGFLSPSSVLFVFSHHRLMSASLTLFLSVMPSQGVSTFWRSHGRRVDPAALSTWRVPSSTHYPQHHPALQQIHQVCWWEKTLTAKFLTSVLSDVIAQIAQLSQIAIHICPWPLYYGNKVSCHWYKLRKHQTDNTSRIVTMCDTWLR